MNISYERYRVFYYVAKYGSITQAANQLLNNQPNITRTIKALERELGCTLFIRSSKGVLLTPEGEKLYRHVKIAVESIQAGEAELKLQRDLKGGTVTIGASEVALRCLLLPILNRFRQSYPSISIRVSNSSTPQALQSLENGLVDLTVITSPITPSEVLEVNPIRTYGVCAVCGDAFAYLAGKELSLEELTKLPLICLGKETASYEFYNGIFHAHGFTLHPEIEAATADQILPMVKNNLGIGFVPREFLNDDFERRGIHILQLKEKIPKRFICLVKHRTHPLSIAARELEKMLITAKNHEE